MSGDRPGRPWRANQPVDGAPAPPGTPLRAALDAYLASRGLREAGTLAQIVASWSAVVGPDVAAHCSPRTLRDKELAVAVDHPAWATEFTFLAEDVRAQLNDLLGAAAVDRVKVHVTARRGVD